MAWHTPTPPRSDISKTALWAENYIDWEYYENILEILKNLKEDWFSIFAVELTSEAIDYKTLFNSDLDKICLIVWVKVFIFNTLFWSSFYKKYDLKNIF